MNILTSTIIFVQKVGKGYGVQIFAITPFNGKCPNLQKTLTHYSASSHLSDVLTVLFFDVKNIGQSHEAQFSQ